MLRTLLRTVALCFSVEGTLWRIEAGLEYAVPGKFDEGKIGTEKPDFWEAEALLGVTGMVVL